jgi:valyl-tRNA synthetase
MTQPFPQTREDRHDEDAETELQWVMQFILGIRQIRGEMDIAPGKPLPVLLQGTSASDRERAVRHQHILERVGRVESITPLESTETEPASATALLGDMRLLVPMEGLIDIDAERARLRKLEERAQVDLNRSRGKLDNEKFVNNAPPEVVTQERERVAEFEKQLAQLAEQLQKLDA